MDKTREFDVKISPTKIFTPGVIVLLVLLAMGFIISSYWPFFSFDNIALSGRGLIKGKIWQLATYPFVNNCPLSLVFSCFTVLFIGSDVERQWRTKSFLTLWLFVSVISGLLWVLITVLFGLGYIGSGAAACTYGILAAFGLLNRGRRFYFFFAVLEAQFLVILFIVAGILINIVQPIGLIWVVGALVGYLYVKLCWWLKKRKQIISSVNTAAPKGNFIEID